MKFSDVFNDKKYTKCIKRTKWLSEYIEIEYKDTSIYRMMYYENMISAGEEYVPTIEDMMADDWLIIKAVDQYVEIITRDISELLSKDEVCILNSIVDIARYPVLDAILTNKNLYDKVSRIKRQILSDNIIITRLSNKIMPIIMELIIAYAYIENDQNVVPVYNFLYDAIPTEYKCNY
jgi:hypothetical protein